mmetsp:Transcript_35997/g.69025  ORF Transcript_35997/g.69025 Transcript_35997/m.69025 type:complete len:207 (+) Transcript_35997:531-1151(+)
MPLPRPHQPPHHPPHSRGVRWLHRGRAQGASFQGERRTGARGGGGGAVHGGGGAHDGAGGRVLGHSVFEGRGSLLHTVSGPGCQAGARAERRRAPHPQPRPCSRPRAQSLDGSHPVQLPGQPHPLQQGPAGQVPATSRGRSGLDARLHHLGRAGCQPAGRVGGEARGGVLVTSGGVAPGQASDQCGYQGVVPQTEHGGAPGQKRFP